MTRYKKEAEAKSQIVRVRDIGSTYVATGGGKRTSCTAGAFSAAHAHALKLFGDRPFNLVSLRETGTYHATVIQQEPCK